MSAAPERRYYRGPAAPGAAAYLGHEFCERLLPSAEELRPLLAAGSGPVLLTPYCTQAGLGRLRPLLELLAPLGAEVAVNDYGVLKLLRDRYPSLKPALGRLLTSLLLPPYFSNGRVFERGEFLENTRNRLRPDQGYFAWLRENGVARLEFDNPFAAAVFGEVFSKEGFGVTLYTPYTYVTTTRRCLFASAGTPSTKTALLGCSRQCLGAEMRLQGGHYPARSLYVRGNAQFILNDGAGADRDWGEWGADRLVEFPA